jgi:hypothetical protein
MVDRRQRAHAWIPSALTCTALLAAAACSAPPGTESDFDDGAPEYVGPVPGASGITNPAPAAPGAGTSGTGAAPVAGGGEQNQTGGTPIAPSTPPASNGNTNNAGTNTGAGGSTMAPPTNGAGGSSMVPANGAGGATNMPPAEQPQAQQPPAQQPPAQQPPAQQPPAQPAGPDIPCPADATFCSGFEGTGLPAGSQFEPPYLAGEALTTQMELDTTVFHAGGQSLHMPAGANYYRMLSAPVPGRSFWVRLFTRSNVGFGAQGSTHATLFMASIVEQGGDYNADRAVEIAEQFDQILLNVKDSLFGTSGTNPNGQEGTTLADNAWACMEAQFDGASGDVHIFVDGSEIIDATGWQAPADFKSFRFGYLRFSSPERDVWMDDVVVASSRIGCQ